MHVTEEEVPNRPPRKIQIERPGWRVSDFGVSLCMCSPSLTARFGDPTIDGAAAKHTKALILLLFVWQAAARIDVGRLVVVVCILRNNNNNNCRSLPYQH